jgi:uncharacterized protein
VAPHAAIARPPAVGLDGAMRRLILTALALWLTALPPAAAQEQAYPDPLSPYVSDHADLIGPEAEARLTEALSLLREETGTEFAVVTIPTRAAYAPSASLEAFATGLFNSWGIGDPAKNDGILVLVIPEDREMRIELGAGYPPVWDTVAENVIDNSFLPRFREDLYEEGIERGTLATIDRIARPFALNQPPPEESFSFARWFFEGPGAFLVIFGAVVGPILYKIAQSILARFRPCPNCGARRLRIRRTTLTPSTTSASGEGEENVTCANCDYTSTRRYTISRRSSSSRSSSGFSGGRSSGGGASGRW